MLEYDLECDSKAAVQAVERLTKAAEGASSPRPARSSFLLAKILSRVASSIEFALAEWVERPSLVRQQPCERMGENSVFRPPPVVGMREGGGAARDEAASKKA